MRKLGRRLKHLFSSKFRSHSDHIETPSSPSTPSTPYTHEAERRVRIKMDMIHPQSQSPLFQLPGEIRNTIYELVLSEEDSTRAHDFNGYWWHPMYTHFQRIPTEILATCKIAFAEAKHLPARNATFRFWLSSMDRCPTSHVAFSDWYIHRRHRSSVSQPPAGMSMAEHLSKLTLYPNTKTHEPLELQSSLRRVSISGAQLYALERGDLKILLAALAAGTGVEELTLTVRYSDWWNWESNVEPQFPEPNMAESWQIPVSVKRLRLIFQTRFGCKKTLDALMDRHVAQWRLGIDRMDERVVTEEQDVVEPDKQEHWVLAGKKADTWVGSSKLGGEERLHHSNEENGTIDQPLPDGEMLFYEVTTLWEKRRT